ncbi:hypothetical protein ACU4GD_37940 [Cupriavidus basilensis]
MANYRGHGSRRHPHHRFIKEKKGFGPLGQIVAIAAAVAISIVTAGAGAVTACWCSLRCHGGGRGRCRSRCRADCRHALQHGEPADPDRFMNMGAALKAGVVSKGDGWAHAGCAGCALNLGGAGVTSIGQNIAKGSWEAVQANLGNYIQASVVRSVIAPGSTRWRTAAASVRPLRMVWCGMWRRWVRMPLA